MAASSETSKDPSFGFLGSYSHFEVFKPFRDHPGKTRFVYLHNNSNHPIFEAAADSNKGFKSHFFLVRAQSKARNEGTATLDCPNSWSREHDEFGYQNFNLDPADLEGEDKETYGQLQAWGARLRKGSKKFHCGEILKKGAESPEALHLLLNEWHAYDSKVDPSLAVRARAAAEKARRKTAQKRKRPSAGTDNRSSGSQTVRPNRRFSHVVSVADPTLLAELEITPFKQRTLLQCCVFMNVLLESWTWRRVSPRSSC